MSVVILYIHATGSSSSAETISTDITKRLMARLITLLWSVIDEQNTMVSFPNFRVRVCESQRPFQYEYMSIPSKF